MNRQEIIQMVKKAGLDLDGENIFSPESDPQVDVHIADLEVFAALVASAERERLTDAAMKSAEKAIDVAIALEREACAKIAHQWSKLEDDVGGYIEAAIRARGNHD